MRQAITVKGNALQLGDILVRRNARIIGLRFLPFDPTKDPTKETPGVKARIGVTVESLDVEANIPDNLDYMVLREMR